MAISDFESPRRYLDNYLQNHGVPITVDDFIRAFNAGLYREVGEEYINEGRIQTPTLEEKVLSSETQKYRSQSIKSYTRTRTRNGVSKTFTVRAYHRNIKIKEL